MSEQNIAKSLEIIHRLDEAASVSSLVELLRSSACDSLARRRSRETTS